MIFASFLFWLLLKLVIWRDEGLDRVEPVTIVRERTKRESPRVDTRQNILVYDKDKRVIEETDNDLVIVP